MSDPIAAHALTSTAASTAKSAASLPDGESAAIILAAGRSTRMRSKMPKPLHPLCGLAMTGHVIRTCREAGITRIVVVIGHEAETVRAGLGEEVEYVIQEEPRGTGDAVKSAHGVLGSWRGTIVVLAGDVPLLPAETLSRLIAKQTRSGAAVTMLTAYLDDPHGYGRVVRNVDGRVARIVEHKDATPVERALKEWNPSIYAFDSAALWTSLADIQPANAQGEFYLTDTIGLLNTSGAEIEAIAANDSNDVLGVNTRVELAEAAAIMRRRILNDLMIGGVTITDPASTYVETDVAVGQDTVIEPQTFLYRNTRIGEDCVIGPFTRIEGSTISNRVRIIASQVVGSAIEDDVKVGPYANLRPGTQLGRRVKIGDFVETKNAVFGEGAQASHLSYIGDAEIGAGTNLGAGAITCNYDGFSKHRTVVGPNAFIGSHSTLIAPVTVGAGAIVAAATTVSADIPANALAIARIPLTVKEGSAARYRARRAAKKETPGAPGSSHT